MDQVYHSFQVTDKVDMTLQQAFTVAEDIISDVATTIYNEWPERYVIKLQDVTKNQSGIRTYHFDVIVVEDYE